jgi:hypothetical protein
VSPAAFGTWPALGAARPARPAPSRPGSRSGWWSGWLAQGTHVRRDGGHTDHPPSRRHPAQPGRPAAEDPPPEASSSPRRDPGPPRPPQPEAASRARPTPLPPASHRTIQEPRAAPGPGKPARPRRPGPRRRRRLGRSPAVLTNSTRLHRACPAGVCLVGHAAERSGQPGAQLRRRERPVRAALIP